MRVALLAALAGCSITHTSPAPEADAAPSSIASALFTPILCTGGSPGDVSGCGTGGVCCPFNTIDLTVAPFSVDARLAFIAQALTTSDLYINAGQLTAGADGLFVENLRLAIDCLPRAGAGMTFDLAPNTTAALPTEALVGGSRLICIAADAIGPYRP